MTLVVRKYPVALQDSPVAADEMQHWPHPSPPERQRLRDEIRRLLKTKDAVLIAHYYVHEDLQRLAEETGGYVSDSLDIGRFGPPHPAKTLVVARGGFIGGGAQILNPEKRGLMPTLEAECSL